MTSAPNQANIWVQDGPAWSWVKSMTRYPSRALLMCPLQGAAAAIVPTAQTVAYRLSVRFRRANGKTAPAQSQQRPRFDRFDPRRRQALYLEDVEPGATVTDLEAERQELVQELRRQG